MNEPGPTTSVTILGEEFRIRGASPELVQDLAGFVDRKFRDLGGARPSMDLKRLAVMVCMNIAEELFEERARGTETVRRAHDRTRRCREVLEGLLAGPERTEPSRR